MVTMYSKADLESKKKVELQQIVKNLGLKGCRLKAELIDLILENQSEVDPSASPAADSDGEHELLAAAAQDVASAIIADSASKEASERESPAAASDSENRDTSILDLDNMLAEDQLDFDVNLNKKSSRSGRRNAPEEDDNKDTQLAAEPSQPRLKRSNTFHLDSLTATTNADAPPTASSNSTASIASPHLQAPVKGRAKRQRSTSPQPREPSSPAVKRTRRSRVPAAVAATLPRRGRRGMSVAATEPEPRRHSRGSSPKKASAVQPLLALNTTPEARAAENTAQLEKSNLSQVLQKTPSTKEDVSGKILTKRTILTPKRTLKTPSRASSVTKTVKSVAKPTTPAPAAVKAVEQHEVYSPIINPPTLVPTSPQTPVLNNSPPSTPATETPVSGKRLSRAASLTKPGAVLPSGESLAVVASPRLSAVSTQGRRLSSAKKLSSASSLVKRVVPTLAQPVFTIGKHDKKVQDKDDGQPGGKAKSSIPRFMAYAQKISKMPNFKRIHEKAFNNMQNLDEFVTKKKQLSNSVQKASTSSASFVPSVVSTKEMKLNFSDKSPAVKFGAGTSTATRPQTPRLSVATAARPQTPRLSVATATRPQTPRLSVATNKPIARLTTLASATPRQVGSPKASVGAYSARKTGPSAAFASSLKENMMPRSPRVSLATPYRVPPRATVTKTMPSAAGMKSSIPRPSPKSVASGAHHRAALKPRAQLQGPVPANKGSASGDVSSVVGAANTGPVSKLPQYKPYRGPLRSPSHSRAALKQLASKKPTIATREERRDRNKEYIKGVRTNKRFQLQMERRGVTS